MAESSNLKQDVPEDSKDKSSLDKLSPEELKERIKKYLFYLKESKKKCDDLSEKCMILEEERDAANEVILKWQNDNQAEKVAELQNHVRELKKESERLTSGKHVVDEELAVLATARDTALEALKKMKNELSLSQSKNQDYVSEIEELVKNGNEFKEQLTVKNDLELKHLEEIQNLTNKYDEISEKYEKIYAIHETLKLQFDCIIKEKEKLYQENSEFLEIKSQYVELKKNEDILKNENALLEQNIKDVNNLNSELSENYAKVTEENEMLKKNLTDFQDNHEQLRNMLEGHVKHITKNGTFTCDSHSDFSEILNILNKKYEDLEQQNNIAEQAHNMLLKLPCFNHALEMPPLNLLEISESICCQYEDLKFQLNELENEKLDRESTENDANIKIQLLEDNIKNLTDKLELECKANQSMTEKLKYLEKEKSDLLRENTDLQQKCNTLLCEISVISSAQTMLLQLPCFEDDSQSLNMLQISQQICDCYSELKIKLDALENEKLDEDCRGNKEIKELENIVRNLSLKLEDLQCEIALLTEELNVCKYDKEVLEKTNLELTDKNNEIHNCYKKLLEEISDVKLKLHTSNINNISDINSITLKEITDLICECYEDLKIKLKAMENEKLKENDCKEMEINELEKKLTELSTNCDLFYKENQSLKENIEFYENKEAEYSELRSEFSILKQKNEDLMKHTHVIDCIHKDFTELLQVFGNGTEFTNIIEMSNFVSNECTKLKENIDIIEKEKLELKDNREKLILKIQELDYKIVDLLSKLNFANEENQSLISKLSDHENLEKQLMELTSEKVLLDGKHGDILQSYQILKEESEHKDDLILELEKKISNLQQTKNLVSYHNVAVGEEYISSDISIQTDSNNQPDMSEIQSYGVSEWGCADETCINDPLINLTTNNVEPVNIKKILPDVNSTSSQTDQEFITNLPIFPHNDLIQTSENHVVHSVPLPFGISEWGCVDETSADNTDMATGDNNYRNIQDVGIDVFSQTERMDLDKEIQTDSTISEIENLVEVNEVLRKQIEIKSKLAEDIQCLLDSRLEKEEDFNNEMSILKQDLEISKQKNETLEQRIMKLNEINKILEENLKTIRPLVQDLENNVKSDIDNFKFSLTSILVDAYEEFSSKCSVYDNNIKNMEKEIENYKSYLHDIIFEVNDILKLFSILDFIEITNCEFMDNDTKEIMAMLTRNDLLEEECLNKLKEHLRNQTIDIKRYLQLIFSNTSKLKTLEQEQENELNKLKEFVIPTLEKQIQDIKTTSNNNQKLVEETLTRNEDYALLNNQILEAETKMNKFKAVALRLKRELAESQNKYQDCVAEKEKYKKQTIDMSDELNVMSDTHSKYVLNFQNLQHENDNLQDECDDLKSTIKTLQSNISVIQTGFDNCKTNSASAEIDIEKLKQQQSALEMQKKDIENKCNSLEGKIIILETKSVEDQNNMKDLVHELTKSRNETMDLIKEKEVLLQKLDDALKEGKQHSLIDLEMADYERSIEELTVQLEKKNNQNEELKNDNESLIARIDTMQAEIKICENHRDIEEKRAEGFKEALENTKKELTLLREEETDLRSNFIQANLKLEILGQKDDDSKAEISKLTAEIEKLKVMIENSAANHDRIVRSLKSKISSQEQNILMAHKEVESVKQDFENYKIRVHSVLKQQKNVSNITSSDIEEKQNLEAQIEKLKLQMKELSEKLLAITLEKEILQEEYNHLLQRNSKIIEEFELKNENWNTRLEQVNLEKSKLQMLLHDTTLEHTTQNEIITSTYKKQIKNMQEDHKIALKNIQAQLEAASIKIANLEREQQRNANFVPPPLTQEEPFSFDIFSQERQEGEGSECNENGNMKPLSLATVPTGGFIPLDKLLQSPADSEKSFSFTSLPDAERLNNELNASTKKFDHIRGLLNESEANNMRLAEQVRLLKEEIRRLERNKQRIDHEENLEYLKNVFVKFSTLEPGSERTMLIPVLTTMLKLSPDEQQKLKSVAGDKSSSDSANSWGSYLHRWSGT